MPATTHELIEWRDKLVKARATGMKRIDYDGYVVTYRNDAEMKAALKDLESRIAEAQGGAASARGPIRVHTHKGV